MIYLFGISHSFQINASKPLLEGGLDASEYCQLACKYESYLNDEINRLRPQIVCEEYDEVTLHNQMNLDDQVYLIARKACQLSGNICHMFIDPDRNERISLCAALGKTEEEDKCEGYPIREREWFRRMRPILHNSSIFVVCGANHITSFQQLLISNDYETSIICKDFESNINSEC